MAKKLGIFIFSVWLGLVASPCFALRAETPQPSAFDYSIPLFTHHLEESKPDDYPLNIRYKVWKAFDQKHRLRLSLTRQRVILFHESEDGFYYFVTLHSLNDNHSVTYPIEADQFRHLTQSVEKLPFIWPNSRCPLTAQIKSHTIINFVRSCVR